MSASETDDYSPTLTDWMFNTLPSCRDLTGEEELSAYRFLERIKYIINRPMFNFDFARVMITQNTGRHHVRLMSPQDQFLPVHVFNWDATREDKVVVTSRQWPKSILPPPNSPRRLRFQLPPRESRGLRRFFKNSLESLRRDIGRYDNVGIRRVHCLKETPREMIYEIFLQRNNSHKLFAMAGFF